jgi:PAS domain-containing protein
VHEHITDAQGHERFFETRKFPVRMKGRTPLLGGISVDVTERRRAEEQFRQVVELSPWGIFLELEGNFVYVNPAYVRLRGAERPEQLIGMSMMDGAPPEIREQVAERMRIVNKDRKSPPPWNGDSSVSTVR